MTYKANLKAAVIEATYEMIIDADELPHLQVDLTHPEMLNVVPEFRKRKINLNIGPMAVLYLTFGEHISFQCKVNGHVIDFNIPVEAIEAIGAHGTRNGAGFGKRQPKLILVK